MGAWRTGSLTRASTRLTTRTSPPGWPDLADGNPGPIATRVAAQLIGSGIGALGYGLGVGVSCAEWVPYQQGSVLSEGRRAFPSYPASVLTPALHVTYTPDFCTVWPVPKAPAEQRAATPSTIPTLLFNGSFDSVTATSWERIAVRTLPNSTVLEFAGIGHFVVGASPCAQQVFASFLATPGSPNTACVAAVTPPTFTPAPTGHKGNLELTQPLRRGTKTSRAARDGGQAPWVRRT